MGFFFFILVVRGLYIFLSVFVVFMCGHIYVHSFFWGEPSSCLHGIFLFWGVLHGFRTRMSTYIRMGFQKKKKNVLFHSAIQIY